MPCVCKYILLFDLPIKGIQFGLVIQSKHTGNFFRLKLCNISISKLCYLPAAFNCNSSSIEQNIKVSHKSKTSIFNFWGELFRFATKRNVFIEWNIVLNNYGSNQWHYSSSLGGANEKKGKKIARGLINFDNLPAKEAEIPVYFSLIGKQNQFQRSFHYMVIRKLLRVDREKLQWQKSFLH